VFACTSIVMRVVSGALSTEVSLTINCTTNKPAASAMKLASGCCGLEITAELPIGIVINAQRYVSGSLLASNEPVPSSTTVSSTVAV
jgi:hypothetical protein